jgi:mannose-6-phosphate isomerase-like protein (cupin superfamily)
MGTLSQIQHREQIDEPFIVEHLDLPEYYIEDILSTKGDFKLSNVAGNRKVKVISAYLYNLTEDRPDIVDELMNRYNMEEATVFISMDDYTRTGLHEHADPMEICCVNLVGKTEWIIEGNNRFELDVGDVLYVPAFKTHKVNPLTDERLSMSFYRSDNVFLRSNH